MYYRLFEDIRTELQIAIFMKELSFRDIEESNNNSSITPLLDT